MSMGVAAAIDVVLQVAHGCFIVVMVVMVARMLIVSWGPSTRGLGDFLVVTAAAWVVLILALMVPIVVWSSTQCSFGLRSDTSAS